MTTILIVEDDRATTGLFKTILEMEGFETVICPQADRVMETVRQTRPELVFMDYHLGDEESLSILREMKQDPELQQIPVLMTSGLDRSEECERAGADDFLIKPFRPGNLLDRIRGMLNQRG